MGRSKRPSLVVIENHDELVDMNDEIATNYLESGESYDWKTTVVDKYFASKIIGSMDLNLESKSMAECRKHSDWDK
jgi:hypothetical protein